MGAVYFLFQLLDWRLGLLPCSSAAWAGDLALLLPLAACAGVLGSLLDSFLGATLQYSGFDERSRRATSMPPVNGSAAWVKHVSGRDLLSNTAVNVVSSLATSLAAAAVVQGWC